MSQIFKIKRSTGNDPGFDAVKVGDTWMIEIRDLEHLIKMSMNDEIIIDGDSLEIYDTYRE